MSKRSDNYEIEVLEEFMLDSIDAGEVSMLMDEFETIIQELDCSIEQRYIDIAKW